MKVALHCHNCGARAEVELSEQQSTALRNQGYINRACRECVGITRWELHAVPEAPASSGLPFAGCRGRVLVIDDDIDVLTVLSKNLAKHKFDVVVADSAREALTMLARGDFDVVVSDIRMPEFGGSQLMEFLDEHLPDYKERVVFMSGDTASPETMAFVAQARRPFLPKPLDMPLLLETIRPLLPEAAGFVPFQDSVTVAAVEPPPMPAKPEGDMTADEKSATEEALSYALIALRSEVKTLKRTLDERNAEVEALRRELAGREADGRKKFEEMYQEQEHLRAEAARALEEVKKELEEARARASRLEADTTLQEREKDFARREQEFTQREKQLQKELKEAAQASQRLEDEVEALRQQAAEAEARAAAARKELEGLRPLMEQGEADAARWQKAMEEVRAEAEHARRDLAVACGRYETELTQLRHKAIEAQSEMGKMMGQLQEAQTETAQAKEELKKVREALQQAGAELQRAQEELKQQAAAFAPEEKNRLAQWEASREQREQAQARALRLETILRQFYSSIVNPLTVAVATTDLASSSQWLSPRDRETLQLLEQNLDHLLEAVKKLKKEMQELSVDFG
ncbi:MAG TPA: response regulator [Candidatus Xenobia bacterium]|nr:response regulator [Candidatus Xenobia bacterium]